MTDEQAARIRIEELCYGRWPQCIAESLDTYRDAIVAATKAEPEAKLAAVNVESPVIGYVPNGCLLPEERITELWHEFTTVATAWTPRVGTPLDFARSVEREVIDAVRPRPR